MSVVDNQLLKVMVYCMYKKLLNQKLNFTKKIKVQLYFTTVSKPILNAINIIVPKYYIFL